MQVERKKITAIANLRGSFFKIMYKLYTHYNIIILRRDECVRVVSICVCIVLCFSEKKYIYIWHTFKRKFVDTFIDSPWLHATRHVSSRLTQATGPCTEPITAKGRRPKTWVGSSGKPKPRWIDLRVRTCLFFFPQTIALIWIASLTGKPDISHPQTSKTSAHQIFCWFRKRFLLMWHVDRGLLTDI